MVQLVVGVAVLAFTLLVCWKVLLEDRMSTHLVVYRVKVWTCTTTVEIWALAQK